MKWLAKVRFLPLTIFFATLMLTVKISDIWDGVDGLISGPINVSEAQAQTQPPQGQSNLPPAQNTGAPAQGTLPAPRNAGAPAQSALPPAQGALPPAQGALPPAQGALPPAQGGLPPAQGAGAAPGGGPEVSRLIKVDPTLLTPAEIDILQQLAVRRDQLDAREKEIQMRTGLLNAAEERINKKIAELQTLRVTIDGLIKKFDAQQDAKLKSLVKIYENMKPKDAAKIFEELEMDTLLEVAERMKERKLADILAKMPPERAREVTVELRQLRELPKANTQAGG
jgi:flagellar motility protein MotE (MotC chaperone)